MPLSIGQTLYTRYRIVQLLAQGGFGTIYRAWDGNLNRPCAVKENLDVSPEAQQQFGREATLLANLNHPNLVRVTDHFFLPNQGQYLVMDFVDGEDLQEMLDRTHAPIPEAQVLNWIGQVCDALIYLHSQTPPVIHRDLKPANIKITPDGRAMLVDFGIAKVYDPKLKTTIGARAITPGYSPLEQYGQGTTDARTDVYALGATLYTLLTGQIPPESVARAGGVTLPALRTYNSQVSSNTEQTVRVALSVTPTQRHQTVANFKSALLPTVVPATPPSLSPIKWQRVFGVGAAVVGGVVLTCLGLALAANFMPTPTPAPTSVAITSPSTAIASRLSTATRVTSSTSPASGTIRIVSDLPMTGSSLGQTQSMVNAITQAFESRSNRVCGGKWAIDYKVYDDASAARGAWDPEVVTKNAKEYAADSRVVAVIGTFNSGAAKLMIPILNPTSLVMISPGNTYPGLTKPGKGIPGEPDVYYTNRIRNYTRVTPADDMQGTVGAQWAKDLGAKSVYVVDDQDLYGSTLANAFEQTAKDIGLIILGHEKMNPKAVDYKTLAAKVKDANTDLFYFGGITQNNAGQLIKDLRSIGFKGMIMGPDGIYEEAFVKAAGSAADGVYLTFGGLPVDKLSGTGAVWRTAYRSKYGNDPEIYATYAYTAAQLAMDALDRVCQAGQNPADRKAVRDAVFATKDFDSVLGKFSIDANGDTTNTLMSGVQIKSGRFEFVTVLGK